MLPSNPRPAAPASTEPTWEQVAAELRDVGIPDEQARMYVQLLRRGPASASELAEALAISRPQSYRVLEALTQDAFVTSSVGRPRVFVAAPPSSVLRSLRERTQRSLEHIDRVQGLLGSRLEALRQEHDSGEGGPHFTVLRGVDALAKTAYDVCRDAEERIDVLLGPDTRGILFEAFVHPELLTNRAQEGIDIRLLAPAHALVPRVPLQRRLLEEGSVVTLLMADGRDALIGLTTRAGDRGNDATLGVRSNAEPFVAAQHLLFEHLWQRTG